MSIGWIIGSVSMVIWSYLIVVRGGFWRLGQRPAPASLARLVKREGRTWLGLSAGTRSIREYRSWRPIWLMVTRSAFAQLRYSPLILAATLLPFSLTYFAPPLLVFFAGPEGMALGGAGLAGNERRIFTFSAVPRYIACGGGAITVYSGFLASAVLYWRGRGGYWKGRFQAGALADASPTRGPLKAMSHQISRL
jgi:hypothetical protein